jgi:hypothetical protein
VVVIILTQTNAFLPFSKAYALGWWAIIALPGLVTKLPPCSSLFPCEAHSGVTPMKTQVTDGFWVPFWLIQNWCSLPWDHCLYASFWLSFHPHPITSTFLASWRNKSPQNNAKCTMSMENWVGWVHARQRQAPTHISHAHWSPSFFWSELNVPHMGSLCSFPGVAFELVKLEQGSWRAWLSSAPLPFLDLSGCFCLS